MANKQDALRVIPRQRLPELTACLGLEVAEDAGEQGHLDALEQASDADMVRAFQVLTRNQLRAMCGELKLSKGGRKKDDLIATIIGSWASPEAVQAAMSDSVGAEPDAADKGGAGAQRKPALKSLERQQKESAEREQEREIREPGWSHIDASTLAALDATDFARLCHELLTIECYERHADSTLLERTPVEVGHFEDLRCMVTERPRVSANDYARRWSVAPLIADTPGVTIFRCKAGTSWRAEAKKDAKDENDWARNVLQAGGRLVILTNESRKRRREKTQLERQLANSYARLMKDRDPDIDDLGQRINIVPADDLALFIRSRRPLELSLESRDLLGVNRIPRLVDFDTWAWAHLPELGQPLLAPAPYVWDPLREEVRDQVLSVLSAPSEDPYSRVAWLDGARGVGKTRLLIETLRERPDLRSRTLIAPSLDEAIAALSAHRLFRQYPTAVLIIDDCPARRLIQLIPWLERHDHRGIGGLIIMTESNRGDAIHVPGVFHRCRMDIAPLTPSAHRRLLAEELGDTDDSLAVSSLSLLTIGAPWLATLVAREVAAGAPLPETAAEAVELAIASHDEPEREEQLDLRIRVLLMMMLTGDLDWKNLTRSDRGSLCKAVGVADFETVERGRQACLERGLLRVHMGGNPERVTPVTVAREVATKMLQPTVEGPAPQATPLGQHARRLLPALYRRLEPLGLDRLVAIQLAAPIANALELDVPGLAVLGETAVGRSELVFATRYQLPQRMARILGRRIAETSIEELRERVDVRSALVEALECLAGRRWSFERGENALFRLAQAENQVVSSNATTTWANMFAIENSQTYRSFAIRMSLLEKRCTTGPVADRVLALEGVRAALTVNRFVPPGDALDGPYPVISTKEALASRLIVWKLAIQAMGESVEEVAIKAGEVAVECLPGAAGVAALNKEIAKRLADVGPLLPEVTQRALREVMTTLIEERKAKGRAPSEEWTELMQVLEPRSFSRKLHDHIGKWSIESDEDTPDRALARLGLAEPGRAVLKHLDWIGSDEAVRRVSFATALGGEDDDRVVLDHLVGLVRSGAGADVLASYLYGWQQEGGEKEVIRVLRSLRVDSELSEAVVLTVWRLGASDKNVSMLLELLDRGTVTDETLHIFATGRWAKGLTMKSLSRLVGALLSRQTPMASDIACALIIRRLGPGATSKKKWRTLLEKALRGATSDSARRSAYWQRSALSLVDADVDIYELVFDAAVNESRSLENHVPWSIFDRCAERSPKKTWAILVGVCESADHGTARRVAHAVGRHHIARRFDVKMVMDWVGKDDRRGAWVARMLPMHDSDALPSLAHELLTRLGPKSLCAVRLQNAVTRPPHNITSDMSDFHGVQIARARRWSEDSAAEVREWGRDLINVLEKRMQALPG